MDTRSFVISANKFFYYSMNYDCKAVTYKPIWGEEKTVVVPSFMDEVKWGCSMAHIVEKWFACCNDKKDSYGTINRFYAELDGNNRAELLMWINENYELREDFGINL